MPNKSLFDDETIDVLLNKFENRFMCPQSFKKSQVTFDLMILHESLLIQSMKYCRTLKSQRVKDYRNDTVFVLMKRILNTLCCEGNLEDNIEMKERFPLFLQKLNKLIP